MLVKKKNLVAQEDLVKIFASKHPRLDSQQFLSIEIEVSVEISDRKYWTDSFFKPIH